MKNNLSYIALVLSAITFLLALCRIEPIELDWMSFLVGILALLVTTLVGWQIFQSVNFTNEKKRLIEEVKEYEGRMQLLLKAMRNEATLMNEHLFNFYIEKGDVYAIMIKAIDIIRMNEDNEILVKAMAKAIVEMTPNGVIFSFQYQKDSILQLLKIIKELKPLKEESKYLEIWMQRVIESEVKH